MRFILIVLILAVICGGLGFVNPILWIVAAVLLTLFVAGAMGSVRTRSHATAA